MKLSEYLNRTGMSTDEYFKMQKRRSEGVTTLGDYQRNERASFLSRIENLQNESQSVYDTYKSRFFDENDEYKNTYRGDTEEAYNTYSTFKTKFDTESQEILSYLDKYGSQLDEKYVTSVKDWLTSNGESFNKMQSAYKYDFDTLSQYKNEDEYKKAVAEQKVYNDTRAKMLELDLNSEKQSIKDLEELHNTMLSNREKQKDAVVQTQANLHNLKTELATYKAAQAKGGNFSDKIAKLESQIAAHQKAIDDFNNDKTLANIQSEIESKKLFYSEAEKYQKVVADAKALAETMKTPEFAVDAQKGYDQFLKDEEAIKAENDRPWWEIALEGMAGPDTSLPSATITQVSNDLKKDRSYLLPNEKWSPDDKNLFGYYYLHDRDKAWEFAEQTNNEINKGLKEEQIKTIEGSATSGLGTNLVHQGLAILGNMTGAVDYLYDILEYNARGTITDKSGVSPFEYSQAVRGATAEYLNDEFGTLNEDIAIFGGKGWGDVYQLGTSIIDSAATTYALGPFGTAVTFFGSAAASAVDDARAKGVSNEQALIYGTLMGAAEAGAEYIGAEKLLNIGSSKTLKEAFSNILKQGASEGIEEGVTSILGQFADNLVMGDMSEYRTKIRNYMLYQGMSQDEAVKKAFKEMAEGVAYDTIGGFVSGAAHAAPATAYQTVGTRIAEGSEIKDAGQTANLIDQAKSLGDGSKAAKLAGKITDKSSAYKVGKLYSLTGMEIDSQNRADIIKSLERKGYGSKEAASIADTMLGKKNNDVFYDPLYDSDKVTKTHDDIIANEKSTVSKRMAGYNAIAEGVIDYNVSETLRKQFKSAVEKENNSTEGNSKSIEETAIERKFEASEEGKTINNATGEIVDIEEIASIDNGKMTLKVKNNEGAVETVDADKVSFATDEENIIYSAVLNMDVDAATANAIIGDYKQGGHGLTATRYALGIEEAYRYGLYGIPVKEMTTQGFSASLSETSKNLAYNLGKARGNAIVAERQAKIKAMAKDGAAKKNGKVHFAGDRLALTKIQRESLNGIEVIAQVLGNDIHVYESYVANGRRVYKDANGVVKSAPNGMYYQKDGSIWIDLNAGNLGQGTMLYTAAHELTHFIKQWSPEKFKALADFLVEQYGEKGVSVDTLVKRQIEKAKKKNRTIGYEEAFEEFVADSMTSMLTDGKVIKELYKKDKTLFDKIKSWIDSTLRKIKAIYKDYEIETEEGKIVSEMKDSFEKIQSLFAEALSDASENFAKADVQAQKNTTDEGDVIKFSLMNQNTFESNVDAILSMNDKDALLNAEEGNFIRILDKTPHTITDNVKDAENLEVIISFYSLYLATRKSGALEGHYHNLGNLIKNLPEYIANPQAIVRMNSGRLNLFTQIKTSKGENGILSIELNSVKDINNKFDKYNLVITVYSANDNHTKNNIVENGIKVEYEKEDLLQVNPQLCKWLAIINKRSSNNSIQNPVEKVKENDEDIMYSMRGESTATEELDRQNLEIAKKMDMENIPMENIRLATGWYKQSDGKWRSEFSSKKMKFKPAIDSIFENESDFKELERLKQKREKSWKKLREFEKTADKKSFSYPFKYLELYGTPEQKAYEEFAKSVKEKQRKAKTIKGKLVDIIYFPELFKVYPQLKDVNVVSTGVFKGATAANWDKESNTIKISKELSKEQALNSLTHEIQHAIQDIEGFEYEWDKSYHDRRNEKEAFDAESRRKMSEEQLIANPPVMFSNRDSEAAKIDAAISRGSDVGFVQASLITGTRKLSGVMNSLRTEVEPMPKMIMDISSGNGGVLFTDMDTPYLINGKGGSAVKGYTVAQIREMVMKKNGFTASQIRHTQSFMKSMAKFMEDAGVQYRFIGLQDVENAKLHYNYNKDGSIKSVTLSAMVKNGDYPVNFDFSSICKKRVAMSKLINKLCDMGAIDKGTVNLSPKNLFEINKVLKDEGFETACLGCFVESKRYNVQKWANSFIKKWNEAVLKVNPNATYFGFTDGKTNFDNLTNEQVFAIDAAANKFLNATGKERRDKAKAVYEEKAINGEVLIEKLSKSAIQKIKKSETLDDAMKDYFLSTDPKNFTLEDVNLLVDNEIIAGRAISNKQKIIKMVESGEQFQHLLRPSDLLTERGIMQLEQLPNFHGILYGHYGSGTPKLMQGFTPYNSEIALLSEKKGASTLAEYLYSIGGVRMQSFSDFQVQNVFDYLQMVADLSARKLPAHAYTKEISFAKLLGMTGIKTNLSVMFDIDTSADNAHAGLTKYNPAIHQGEYAKIVLEDEQGKWVYNIGDYATQQAYETYAELMGEKPVKRFLQSIGFADAVKLQTTEGYTKNCGIIGVGYSDAHIIAMLNDPRIRYVIPYHSSSLPHEIKVATNIEKGTDYTSTQNTMKIVKITDKNGKEVSWSIKDAYKRLGSGKAVVEELNSHIANDGWIVETKKAQNGHGSFDLYGDLSNTSDPRATADNFMSWCANNNTLPLFYQFATHNNYYKMLYDFNVYDNVTEEYAPQVAVTNTYPTSINKGMDVTKGEFDDGFFKKTIDGYMKFQNDFNARLDGTVEKIANQIVNNEMEGVQFSDRDYIATDSKAVMTTERIDYLIEDSGSSSPTYAQKWITSINPTDFINLTTGEYQDREKFDRLPGDYGSTVNEYNYIEGLKENMRVTPYISIDENGQVIGHEGRHRMRALEMQGITSAEIVVQFCFDDFSINKHYNSDGERLKTVDSITVENQMGTGQTVLLKNIIPLNKHYRDEIFASYGENFAQEDDIRYHERDVDAISTRSLLANALEAAAQNDIEKAKLNEYKAKIEEMDKQSEKLTELRSQIKELSFSKGPKDKAKISALRDEAIKTANRIDNYDKQLLRLEAAKPLQSVLEREKQKAMSRQKAKDAEAFKAYRDNMESKIEQVRKDYQASRKKAVEGRQRTEMRHMIKRVVNELNQYLLKGTKDKHIMVDLQKSVALALDAVNMDTVDAANRVAKYNNLIAHATDPDVIASLTETRDRIQQMGDRLGDKLSALKVAYDSIKNSDDPDVANAYDEVIMAAIDNVVQEAGDTPLRDMTQKQLESVYDMYTMILTRVRDANKSFKSAKNEDISTRGGKTITEVEKVGGSHSKVAKAFKDIKKFAWNALKPVTAFDVIGSETLGEAFGNVRKGEDIWAVDVKDAKKFYQDNVKKHNYDSWDFKKKHSFTSTSGIKFDLTLEQIMALYAYSKREQADEHLQYGGFVFDDSIEVTEKNKLGLPVKYEVNTANAHNISAITLAQIINNLTAEQKAFVDTMQDYLSTTMGAKGNEVSMAMYGVKLFKEKHYFPLKSAKQFMFEQNQVAGEVKIKNAGFTKETMPHAKNPIILNNFTDVWANHVNDMSMYHAFTLALEDFNRIFNYKTNVSEDFGTQSVKSTLQNAYEKQCVDYIKDLITDLNGGARVDSRAGILNKGIGMFKKAAVFASASVVIQQPSSIARAWAYIDFKYFVTKSGIDKKKHKALWEEIKTYAPVAIIKEMGYFDTHMGMQTTEWIKSKEYDGFKNKVKGAVTDSDYRDELLSRAPAYFDELAWCTIWQAVKHETDKTTNLKPGTEEFLKRCGERFTEIVTKTQVYDSVLSRSGMMRSKDTGMKMATAFMAEPITSLNMLANGIIQGVRGNKSFTRKSMGAVVSSMILNSILVSLVYAARDDDDDEAYLEKYVSTLTEQTIDSLIPFNLIPIVKDVWSIVQGYEVERSDMSIVGDVWNAFTSLSSETKTPYRKVEDFVGAICAFVGLPVKNIMRDARAAYNVITAFTDDNSPTSYGLGGAVIEGVTGDEFTAKDKTYAAIKSGDTATVKKTASDMVKEKVDSGKTEKEAKSAVRSSFTSTFKSQYVAAAKAGDYNEMNRIRKLLYATGLYGTLSELDATLKKWRTEE